MAVLDYFTPVDSTTIDYVPEITSSDPSGAAPVNVNFIPDSYASSSQRIVQNATECTLQWDLAAGRNDFWFHMVYQAPAGATLTSPFADGPLVFRNGTTPLFKLQTQNTSGHWGLYYHDNSVWVQVGSDITTAGLTNNNTNRMNIDIHINIADAGGVFEIYFDRSGTAAASLTGDTLFRTVTTVDNILLKAGDTWSGGFRYQYHLEVLVADEDTREFICEETVGSSNSAVNNAWNGTVGSTDELPYNFNVNDFISSTAANEVETYGFQAHSSDLDTGHTIIGVITYSLARRTTNGGLDIQHCIRSGGTNYFSSTIALSTAWTLYSVIWDDDPSTSLPWANQTAVESIEQGVQSV